MSSNPPNNDQGFVTPSGIGTLNICLNFAKWLDIELQDTSRAVVTQLPNTPTTYLYIGNLNNWSVPDGKLHNKTRVAYVDRTEKIMVCDRAPPLDETKLRTW
jgi:hypothetical protein